MNHVGDATTKHPQPQPALLPPPQSATPSVPGGSPAPAQPQVNGGAHAGAHVGGDASTTSPRKPAPPPAASDPTDDDGVVDGDGVMA